MHVDLQASPEQKQWESDVCIVGAGVAGLLLADRLGRSGMTVHLLEAGGLQQEDESQALYEAEMAADRHSGTLEGRFRTFGGSSTRWGGQLLPYTPDVFHPPPGSDAPVWPIALGELEPYYDELLDRMHVGRLPFTEALLPALGHKAASLPDGVRLRYSKWAPFSQRNLAHTAGKDCLQSANITVFTHANVAELHVSGGRVTGIRVLNYCGESFRFSATTVIVAAGTVESSRVLLLSPEVSNAQGQMGLYFHDHVSLHAAKLPAAARQQIFRHFGPFFVNGTLLTPKLEATPELQQREGLLAVMAHLVIQEPEDSGFAAVRAVLTAVQRGKRPSWQMLLRTVGSAGDLLRLGWALKVQHRRAASNRASVWLNIDMEQPPRAETRVALSTVTDQLGLRKAVVHWSSSEAERTTATRYAQLLQGEFRRLGYTGIVWDDALLNGTPPPLADTYHPMGGLRMGTDPATSVVDRDLRVHGMENLHVASCAVYPTGGSSNPTFTLMALSLRLADHLIGTRRAA